LKFEKLGYEKAVAQGHPDPVAYGKAFADSVLSGGSVPSIGNSGQSTTLSQLPTKGQAEQQQGEGKAAAGTYENYVKDEAKAISDLDTISQVSYALENLKTNKLAPPINFVKSWAEAFGVPVDVEKLGAEQALNSIAGKMAVSMHQPGMGVMTDADLKFYQTLTPSLANTAEGNAKIIDAAKRLAERRLTISRMAQEYKESNPKGILDVGWRKVRDEYIQSNPLYPELVKAEKTKQTVKSFEALPDAKQYDGKRIKFPDGSIHRSVNGQWVKE
jgi:hypothetical protein